MKFSIYQESRQGGRGNNEDRTTYCYSRSALLMVVADGMGGHHYGEIAAQIAVQTLADRFKQAAKPDLPDPFLFLQNGILSGHQAIQDYSRSHNLPDAPRTTCVACLVQDGIAYWAHAGDSRLFLLRGGRVITETRDHSRIRVLLDEGLISQEQAATHPDRNKVYSCLGGPQPPEIEFSRKTMLEHGDVLLLATDGLWSVMSGDMLAIALKTGNVLQTLPLLMQRAEKKGGPHGDNLSVVAMHWEDGWEDALDYSISTHTMAPDEIATRLDAFGHRPGSKVELSDDEIERAIEEIRLAIEKYTPKK